MSWLLLVGALWVAVAVPVGWLIGRSVRLADSRRRPEHPAQVPDSMTADWVPPLPESH